MRGSSFTRATVNGRAATEHNIRNIVVGIFGKSMAFVTIISRVLDKVKLLVIEQCALGIANIPICFAIALNSKRQDIWGTLPLCRDHQLCETII